MFAKRQIWGSSWYLKGVLVGITTSRESSIVLVWIYTLKMDVPGTAHAGAIGLNIS
jgi:hypothetical protein